MLARLCRPRSFAWPVAPLLPPQQPRRAASRSVQTTVCKRESLYEQAKRDLLPGGVPNTPVRRISYDISQALSTRELLAIYGAYQRKPGGPFRSKHHAAVLMRIADLLYLQASLGQAGPAGRAPREVASLLQMAQPHLLSDPAVARLLEAPKIVQLLATCAHLRAALPEGVGSALTAELLRQRGKKLRAAGLALQAELAWACAVLGVAQPILWRDLQLGAARALQAGAAPSLQQLARWAWALGRLPEQDALTVSVMQQLAGAALKELQALAQHPLQSPQPLGALAMLAEGLAAAPFYHAPLLDAMGAAALGQLLSGAVARPPQVSALVRLLQAFASLQHRHEPLYAAASRYLATSIGSIQEPAQLVDIVWAMTSAGQEPCSDALCSSVCRQLAHIGLEDLDLEQLGRLLGALGSAQHYDAGLFEAACARMQRLLPAADAGSARSGSRGRSGHGAVIGSPRPLVQALWACARVRHADAAFLQRASAAIRTQLHLLSASDLSSVVAACNVLAMGGVLEQPGTFGNPSNFNSTAAAKPMG